MLLRIFLIEFLPSRLTFRLKEVERRRDFKLALQYSNIQQVIQTLQSQVGLESFSRTMLCVAILNLFAFLLAQSDYTNSALGSATGTSV